jgi:hypothetical protein
MHRKSSEPPSTDGISLFCSIQIMILLGLAQLVICLCFPNHQPNETEQRRTTNCMKLKNQESTVQGTQQGRIVSRTERSRETLPSGRNGRKNDDQSNETCQEKENQPNKTYKGRTAS